MAKTKGASGIKLLGKSVLVELKKGKTVSDGGIFIPQAALESEEQKEATVISVGSGKLNEGKQHTFEVAAGNVVLLRNYSGMKFEKNGQSYIIVSEDDIVAIIE